MTQESNVTMELRTPIHAKTHVEPTVSLLDVVMEQSTSEKYVMVHLAVTANVLKDLFKQEGSVVMVLSTSQQVSNVMTSIEQAVMVVAQHVS